MVRKVRYYLRWVSVAWQIFKFLQEFKIYEDNAASENPNKNRKKDVIGGVNPNHVASR